MNFILGLLTFTGIEHPQPDANDMLCKGHNACVQETTPPFDRIHEANRSSSYFWGMQCKLYRFRQDIVDIAPLSMHWHHAQYHCEQLWDCQLTGDYVVRRTCSRLRFRCRHHTQSCRRCRHCRRRSLPMKLNRRPRRSL